MTVYHWPHSDALDPKFTTKTVKHPDSVMVWGCFSYYGVGSLVVLPKNIKVNQGVYLEILCDHLPDSLRKLRHEFLCRTVLLAIPPSQLLLG